MKTKVVVLLALVTAFFLGALEAQVVNPLIEDELCDPIDQIVNKGVFCAVYEGNHSFGAGLYGMAQGDVSIDQTRGVFGENYSPTGIGVYGLAKYSDPTQLLKNYGVVGKTEGQQGRGVYGWANSDLKDARTIGVYGRSDSDRGVGVRGFATHKDSGRPTAGVYGRSSSPLGKGVYGYTDNNNGQNYGVYGQSDSTEGRGVVGVASAKTGRTYGVSGASLSPEGIGVYGLAQYDKTVTFFPSGVGVYGQSYSQTGVGVVGFNKATTGRAIGVYAKTASPGGLGVYSRGSVFVKGNISATGDLAVVGNKSAVVSLNNGEAVTFYAEEASENWFADYGMARLENGTAVVNIDPTFAQTVNTEIDYHVFLTPRGDCNGLYVTNQGDASFEVVELQGGQANISFSYRIIAKRIGYETQRLVRISEEEMQAPLLEKDFAEKSNAADQIVLSGMPQISDPN